MKQKKFPKNKIRGRIIFFFSLVCLFFTVLVFRLGQHMIIDADDYAQRAVKQQTLDKTIVAVRGRILDRNGNDLAISATTHTVRVRLSAVNSNGEDKTEIDNNRVLEAKKLAEILGMEEQTVFNIINSEKNNLVRLAKYVDADTAAALAAEKLPGVEITEDAKRYYPLGAFASQLLGGTNDDNVGMMGLELEYDSYLSGLNGRWITNKDSKQNAISYGINEYYAAEDGYNVVTTIDQNIQYIVTQEIEQCKKDTKASRVMCMMMDPSTAEVLAMAQTGEFDPNNPRVPIDEDEAAYVASLPSADQVTYWNKMWRNFCICDTYEPGSTFKLVTTSIALENGVTYMGEKFRCTGSIEVGDRTLKCWYYPRVHGVETLQEAVENSCNPVMVQLSQRIGLEKFYEGLESFGLTELTGIDFPGEGGNILYPKKTAWPVGLATMSYGQGIAVTPISLVTAVSSIANDGYLMQPKLVKALTDSEGNIVESYEPVVKSRSISSQTASDVLSIMEMVVSEGGGGNAKVRGYRIGGKTGTANKPLKNARGYSETDVCASFLGVAPIDDPKFVILVIVDTPRGVLYGSSTAAPCAKRIMEQTLLYLGVEPEYTEAEKKQIMSTKSVVPDVCGMSAEDAMGVLGGKDLKGELSPAIETNQQLVIVDQYPRAGAELTKNSTVTLYYEITQNDTEESENPDIQ